MSKMRDQAVQIINEIPDEKIMYVIDILNSIRCLYTAQSVRNIQNNKIAARASLKKYQGRLPENFNEKNELWEALDEKYEDLS